MCIHRAVGEIETSIQEAWNLLHSTDSDVPHPGQVDYAILDLCSLRYAMCTVNAMCTVYAMCIVYACMLDVLLVYCTRTYFHHLKSHYTLVASLTFPSSSSSSSSSSSHNNRAIDKFAAEYKESGQKLHLLIHTAGVMLPPHGGTEDGFEMQIGVNHIAVAYLTKQLTDVMVASAPGRVVILSHPAAAHGKMTGIDLMYVCGCVCVDVSVCVCVRVCECLTQYILPT